MRVLYERPLGQIFVINRGLFMDMDIRLLIRKVIMETHLLESQSPLTFDELPQKVKDYYKRNITISVAFIKKDGTVRHMAFRRSLNSYIKSDADKTDAQANRLQNNNLMSAYDTNVFIKLKRESGDTSLAAKGSFRNFKLDNVLAFLCGGELFDMRERNSIMERFGPEVHGALTKSMVAALSSDEQSSESAMTPEGPAPLNESLMESRHEEIYFKTFSEAVQHARSTAEKKGYVVDDNDWFNNVTTGVGKPPVGETFSASIKLEKDGIPSKKSLHIQVYGMKNSYELTFYIW